MKAPRLTHIASAVMFTLAAMAAAPVVADDAAIFRKNVSKTADKETEYSNVKMMYFYVPAMNSAGEFVVDLPYVDPETLPDVAATDPDNHIVDDSVYLYRDEAKPLVAVYNDGYVAGVDGTAFIGHGQRDAFVAISLDDGATWRRRNLSRSGTRSSFTVSTPITLHDGTVTTAYPGDVIQVYSAIAGNKIFVAWASRYCAAGFPAYLLAPTDGTASEPVVLPDGEEIVYQDLYDARGAQRSVDYATVDFNMDDLDRTVGEVPFSCAWTSRGQMYTLDDGTTGVFWTIPERLTSGERDVNRIEVTANKGGFAVTWQEDPEGLIPGGGEGSGEGWAGAVTNPETDIWYSYVSNVNFGYIDLDAADGVPVPVELDITALPASARPGVLMSIPVRLTDNAKCAPPDALTGVLDDPYCYADLDGDGDDMDLCNTTVVHEQGNQSGDFVEVCVAEDGRPMLGQASASRARTSAAVAFNADATDYMNWIIVDYEERKALGDIDENADGESDEIGKNIRHHTFEMRTPGVVRQGMQLNQPSTYWNQDWPSVELALTNATSEIVPVQAPGPDGTTVELAYRIFDPDWTCYGVVGDVSTAFVDNEADCLLYDSEIARRASSVPQMVPLADIKNLRNRTSYFELYKEGLDNQGGPADIMGRRWQVSRNYNPMARSPADPRNMRCVWPDGSDGWIYDPRDEITNIWYLEGLCGAPASNVSAMIPEICEDATGAEVDCLYDGTADALDQTLFPKTVVWDQTEYELALNSWWNPYEVSKGHRGFLDGDFLMILYAWSANWKQLADGRDHYNLYIRRSFDGGQTYTTTPSTLGGDGTTTCENFLTGEFECTDYLAGDFEKTRNVSQLLRLSDTVLDPRYTPTASATTGSFDPSYNLVGLEIVDDDAYEDDIRDPSKYFGAFESGDARFIGTEGEPHPWDMFDSRAYNYGDDYYLIPYSPKYPDFAFWDGLETDELKYSGEAALAANPAGTYLYAIWNQWEYDTGTPEADSETINSDAIFRKVLFYYPTIIYDTRTGTGTNPFGVGVTE